MGTLFSALDIGRAGLQVAQVQLDITAHNIANVNKEGFSRQRVELTTRVPNFKSYGAIGRGPAIAGIRRLRESFLDIIYRQSVDGLGGAEVRSRYFSRIEDIFQEPGDLGFGTRLDAFFDVLNDFATNVEEMPVRTSVLAEAEALAASLNQVAQRLRTLRTNANEDVRNLVPEVNSLTSRIAELNRNIRDLELTGVEANDLRDDRDLLIDQLAKLVSVTYRERDDGQVDVLIGDDELVTGTNFREIYAAPTSTIDPSRPDLLEVRFVDNDAAVTIQGGELFGAIDIRDNFIPEIDDRIDELARTLILQLNRIQSSGNGISGIAQALTSTHGVNSSFSPLNLADLPFTVEDGAFDIFVYDSAGNVVDSLNFSVVTTGPLANQTNIADIESAINSMSGISATANADGTITITPAAGNTFTFSNDTSGALAALGLNNFFNGTDAETISVSQHLLDHPEYLSSAYSTDPLETGDNAAALDMANLRTALLLAGGTQSLNEFYQSTVVQIGVDTRANEETLSVEQSFSDDFQRRRLEVSGVSLDEEVTFLIQFQRAFEASARVISVADRMLETLIGVVQ